MVPYPPPSEFLASQIEQQYILRPHASAVCTAVTLAGPGLVLILSPGCYPDKLSHNHAGAMPVQHRMVMCCIH